MSANDIVPTVAEIVGPGKTELVAQRPRALPYVNYDGVGVYNQVFAGWGAQGLVVLARLADECKSARLKTAVGDALIELARSEYDAIVTTSAQQAVGTIFMGRLPSSLGGVIRKGTRFRRIENLDAQPFPIHGAVFECTQDVMIPVNSGGTLFGALYQIPVIAQTPGRAANRPYAQDASIFVQDLPVDLAAYPTEIEIVDPLFDPLLVVFGYLAAGGSDAGNPSDNLIRIIAQATRIGEQSPTSDAVIAGAFAAGVTHSSAVDDPVTGCSVLFVSDADWAYSTALTARTIQSITDQKWRGFGCKVLGGRTHNIYIQVLPTVVLRDSSFLTDTTDVDAAIRNALTSYFDDRPDWWTWKLSAIRGTIARAHRKIQTCTAVSVLDAISGAVLSEPAPLLPFPKSARTFSPIARHYFLTNQGVLATYQAPT